MNGLALHEYFQEIGGRFAEVNGMEVVQNFGDPMAEYAALRNSVGVLDLSFRARLCLTGVDRKRFLHGQVTNNVADLKAGQGCYAALINAKAKMQSDLNIYCLADELLLDFEPGFSPIVTERLQKYIIAEDVMVIDAAPHYGLLSVQGPQAQTILDQAGLSLELPAHPFNSTTANHPLLGEVYCMSQPRGESMGFDLFVPALKLRAAAETLFGAARSVGGRPCGWQALETVRIETGIPRFGADMDETNLPPETGIESRAISYSKGCYIGQEVIARLRTYGQPAKTLERLRLTEDLKELPKKGDKLFQGEKEAGYITSAVSSPSFKGPIALGYIRREFHQPGTELRLRSADGESLARIA